MKFWSTMWPNLERLGVCEKGEFGARFFDFAIKHAPKKGFAMHGKIGTQENSAHD